VNIILLLTAVIAGPEWRKNVGKTDCGDEDLAFLASAIKEGRRRRLQLVSIKQLKTSLKFGLPSIIGYSQKNIAVPRPVLCCRRGFFKIHLFCFFFLAVRYRTACFQHATLTSFSIKYRLHRIQKWFMHFKQVQFVLSKQEKTHVFSIFPPFCSKRSKQRVPA